MILVIDAADNIRLGLDSAKAGGSWHLFLFWLSVAGIVWLGFHAVGQTRGLNGEQ
jgi:hypothetical protein